MTRGSAEWVVRAVRDWATAVGQGVGLVTYRSLAERDRALASLRQQLEQAVSTIDASTQSASEFIEAIRGSTSEVLLVLNPEALIYSKDTDRSPSWLNFYRETIVQHPGVQVWWMPEDAAILFSRDIPDLARFFLFREALTREPDVASTPQPRPAQDIEPGTATRAQLLFDRAFRAADSGAAPARVWLELGIPAATAFLRAGASGPARTAIETLTEKLGPPETVRDLADRLEALDALAEYYAALARALPALVPTEQAISTFGQLVEQRESDPQLLQQFSELCAALHRPEDARSMLCKAVALYQEKGDRLGEANCIASLGDLALQRSDHERARQRFLEALPIYSEVGSRLGEANCIKSLGNIALERSDHEHARQRFLEALPIYREIGDRLGEANCIRSLGTIALRRSDHGQARQRFLEALPIYREIGDRLGEANCIRSLGDIARRRSDHEQARQRFLKALPIYREIDARIGEGDCIRGLGQIAAAQNQTAEAESHYTEALQIYRAIEEPYSIGYTLVLLGRLHPEHSPERRALFTEAIQTWQAADLPNLIASLRNQHPNDTPPEP